MRPASEEEYKSISGSDVGYAGPMKLKAKIVADALIPLVSNGVAGAHKKDVHLKNVNYGRDYKADVVGDIRNIRVNDPCPRCQTPVAFFKGIEVGHVFKLGIKYSEAMKATYLDEGGKAHPMIMGCYGIGVSRIVAAAIEQNSDNWGICWPVPLAPFEVIVTPANITDEKTRTVAEKIYGDLQKAGVDVLFDDRDERAGIKFKDADLIGIPFRVTIGEKSLAKNVVELKVRTAEKAEEIPIESISADVVRRVQALRT
jgi:prolyl-tRNA synthetase